VLAVRIQRLQPDLAFGRWGDLRSQRSSRSLIGVFRVERANWSALGALLIASDSSIEALLEPVISVRASASVVDTSPADLLSDPSAWMSYNLSARNTAGAFSPSTRPCSSTSRRLGDKWKCQPGRMDRWVTPLVRYISTTSTSTVLGAGAGGCSLSRGQGGYSNGWGS